MLGFNLGLNSIVSSSGLSYDVAVQDLIDTSTTAGETIASEATLSVLNAFVLELKAEGVWNLLDTLYVFATDGDINFASRNLKAPSSFKCTLVNTPTFTALEGFQGNGTNSYIDTTWTPSIDGVNYTQLDASMGFYSLDLSVSSNSIEFGCVGSSVATFYGLVGGTTSGVINAQNSGIPTFIGRSTGLIYLDRQDNANLDLVNGTTEESASDGSTGLPDYSIGILVRNRSTTLFGYSNSQCSVFFTGASIVNAGKKTALNTAFNTYMTNI